MKQVTSTAPGVYLIHEEDQPPVEGAAVYQFATNGRWVCQECGEFMGSFTVASRPDCLHIKQAIVYRDREELKAAADVRRRSKEKHD